MLKAIRDFLDQALRDDGARRGHGIDVATAALLVEVMRLDGGADEAEREVVLRAVRERFGLAPDEAARLVALIQSNQGYPFRITLRRVASIRNPANGKIEQFISLLGA